jgi:hypothetical protein
MFRGWQHDGGTVKPVTAPRDHADVQPDEEPRVYAIDLMTPAERAIFVRHLAAAALRWAIADLKRENTTEATDMSNEQR